jgi:WD40 repeat protein
MNAQLRCTFVSVLAVLPLASVIADDPDDKEIARLVQQLRSSDFRIRDTARKRLEEVGEPALEALQRATINVDLEARRRAESIIAVIENKLTHDSLKCCVEQLRLTGHRGFVFAVSVSADGKRLLTGSIDKTLRLWDADTGKELRAFEGHTHFVLGAALSPDGTRVLSASRDNSVRLWDAQTGKELHKMTGHLDGAQKVAFGPKGQALSGGEDGMMRLWDLNTGKQAGNFTCHTHPRNSIAANMMRTVAYSEKAKLAATSGRNQPIRLWNLETGKQVRTFAGSDDARVCFSPDGKRLAACYDETLRIWDVETANELLRIDDVIAHSVAFSPDGKRIVLGGRRDGIVRLWDSKTGMELHKYEGHTRAVIDLAFFPDGKRIVSASEDGTVRIWGTPR